MSDARIILTTTASSDEAERIAELLVGNRLAACVSRVGGMRSTFWWDGRIQRDDEVLVLIKTVANRVAAVRQALHDAHSYELPEFVVLEPESVTDGYLRWLIDSTSAATSS